MENLLYYVSRAIENAKANKSNLSDQILHIDGMSGTKTRHLLNNLLWPGCSYLEIGSWKGSTFVSALYQKHVKRATVIDNWSLFGGPRGEFLFHVNTYLDDYQLKLGIPSEKDNGVISLIDQHCFHLNPKIPENITFDVYFYDGNHDEKDQYKAISEFYKYLSPISVVLIDDWNFDYVRKGTLDAIRDLQINVVWKHEILLTDDNTHTPLDKARVDFWNGIGIFVFRK